MNENVATADDTVEYVQRTSKAIAQELLHRCAVQNTDSTRDIPKRSSSLENPFCVIRSGGARRGQVGPVAVNDDIVVQDKMLKSSDQQETDFTTQKHDYLDLYDGMEKYVCDVTDDDCDYEVYDLQTQNPVQNTDNEGYSEESRDNHSTPLKISSSKGATGGQNMFAKSIPLDLQTLKDEIDKEDDRDIAYDRRRPYSQLYEGTEKWVPVDHDGYEIQDPSHQIDHRRPYSQLYDGTEKWVPADHDGYEIQDPSHQIDHRRPYSQLYDGTEKWVPADHDGYEITDPSHQIDSDINKTRDVPYIAPYAKTRVHKRFQYRRKASPYEEISDVMPSGSYSIPNQGLLDFPREKLTLGKLLSKRNSHKVVKAKAWHINQQHGQSDVIVKMSSYHKDAEAEKDLLQEIEMMKKLKQHDHVIKLLGVCTEIVPAYLILEYANIGNLCDLLHDIRDGTTTEATKDLSGKDLMACAEDIARGMNYLAKKEIVHRYLAAKHVLIQKPLVCKISNFGYANVVIDNNRFYEKTQEHLPFRWMALESLPDKKVSTKLLFKTFSTKSDVWSYGVVLWEMATLGMEPYPGIEEGEILTHLKHGDRLAKPKHCSKEIYKIMINCWEKIPFLRPGFSALTKMFKGMIKKGNEHIDLVAFEERWG
ncbi:fibroblast growth factor receptor 2-like [Glandiceps talaboti]